MSPSRGREYRSLLRCALGSGYRLVSVEQFLDDPEARAGERTLIVRHDVDQQPAAALTMAEDERRLGVRSTWYFRWRTADAEVIRAVRAQGGEVGLHYETLTRRALQRGAGPEADRSALLDGCLDELREELASFRALFGPVRSVAAHGDSRVPWLRNLDVLEGHGPAAIGVEHDANISMRPHRLGAWLTDRSQADGSWTAPEGPFALLRAGCSPILCLTHPNNWTSGPALLRDRILAAALPDRVPGRAARISRALPDTPPRLGDPGVG